MMAPSQVVHGKDYQQPVDGEGFSCSVPPEYITMNLISQMNFLFSENGNLVKNALICCHVS